ncbi:MAG: hypothetical protein QNJ46_31320 [Leptolyngbyaceae cyanobacterium MO_188.B28]|nr:hypothetical protein [Leptolyngbyaceae cyanobacterium MO_188.B28]
MDEVSTVVFSLGNRTGSLPLDQIMGIDELLSPIRWDPAATTGDVIRHLLQENNHPPAYFVLAHLWMKLLPWNDGLASIWAARSLPALLGALSIPAIFTLGWLAFRSLLVAHLSAVVMMLSPFAIFLAQEARHYTAATLVVIASLCCFSIAVRAVHAYKPLPLRTLCLWVGINALGIATHYFCSLTSLSQGCVLLALCWRQSRRRKGAWIQTHWRRIYIVAAGTLVGVLIWAPVWLNFYGSPQASFLKVNPTDPFYWINPLIQSLAGWIFVVLTPATVGYRLHGLVFVIVTILFMLAFLIWMAALLVRSLRTQLQQSDTRLGIQIIGGFFVVANILFFLVSYGLGQDITRGHRYNFVFFPSLIVLVGAGLALYWEHHPKLKVPVITLPFSQIKISGRQFVASVVTVGVVSSLFVVLNLSFPKFFRPDRFIPLIQGQSTAPVVIGTPTIITPKPTVIGIEIMGLGWEIQRRFNPQSADQNWAAPPRFLILEQNHEQQIHPDVTLPQKLAEIERPFDLWLLNYGPDLSEHKCLVPEEYGQGVKGAYHYKHYVCRS